MNCNYKLGWKRVFTSLSVAVFIGTNCIAIAAPSVKEIEAVLKESNDIPKTKKFSVGSSSESDVQVSTYIEPGSKDPDQDCKIDAVLLARTIMTKFSDVKRVTVNFFGFGASKNYKQATITKPEIVAFGSGQVSGGELLGAIRLEEKANLAAEQSSSSSSSSSASSSSDSSSGTEKPKDTEKKVEKTSEKNEDDSPKEQRKKAAKLAYNKALEKGQNPESRWLTYHARGRAGYPGVSFQYPEVWRVDSEDGDEVLVNIKGVLSTNDEPRIELKLYQPNKKRSVIEEARSHAKGHMDNEGFKIERPSAIVKIGQGKSISAITEHYLYREKDKERGWETRHENRYYFGWPGYVYMIHSNATQRDANHINSIMSRLLSTISMK